VIWFVVFFAVGFVLLAAMFAATAALVSRQEDVGSVVVAFGARVYSNSLLKMGSRVKLSEALRG
jgi:hypothetical protein